MDEVKHIFPKGCGYTCPYRDAVSGKCERHRPNTDEIVGAAIEGFRSDMKRIMAKDHAADSNPLAEPLRRALVAADNLLSELDAHQDITGEHLESDDQAIVDGAKEDMAYAKAALKRHRALCDLAENDADLIGNEATQAAYPTGAGEGTVEAMAAAYAEAFYGPGFDPFTNPEAYDMAEKATRAALSAVNLSEIAAQLQPRPCAGGGRPHDSRPKIFGPADTAPDKESGL